LRRGRLRASPRTQSSIAVSADGASWVLVNASPDILAQLRAFPEAQPARSPRDTALAAVMLVDSQIDHTTGLLMLREGSRLPVHCTDCVREDLTTGNPLFKVLEHYCGVDWRRIDPQQGDLFAIEGLPGLGFRAVALASKAPPYSPHRLSPREGDNIGVLIRDDRTARMLFYAPGLGEMQPHLAPIFEAADCLLVDGTFWSDDEMIHAGVGAKRARDMGHLPQTGSGGMLELLARYPRPRKVLIHVNNTNPILDEDSAERAQLAAAGIEVASDGMRLVV
jgi:pyrroloquinoline quinone biosynthesis protein B